eukprot:1886568-Prymnesium_polylepis.1
MREDAATFSASLDGTQDERPPLEVSVGSFMSTHRQTLTVLAAGAASLTAAAVIIAFTRRFSCRGTAGRHAEVKRCVAGSGATDDGTGDAANHMASEASPSQQE